MANEYFHFKQFSINQDKCAMKVGTDGVLLGAWVETASVRSFLDVGTGTGLIALMLAQRSNAVIDAIEIDTSACIQARENVQASPWADRIKVYHSSFKEYMYHASVRYDYIVSNPPYFERSLHALDSSRSVARHDRKFNMEEFIIGSFNLLSGRGRLSMIVPYTSGTHIVETAAEIGLFLNRSMKIRPVPGKTYKRIMMEFSRQQESVSEEELIIEAGKRHNYSPEYRALTREFYLAF